MTRNSRILGLSTVVILGCVISFFSLCPDVFAEEEISSGRKLWDNIMLWVNFGILVFVFMKFARKPLIDFLRGEGKKIEEDLKTVDDKFKDAKAMMDLESDKFTGIDERMEEIKSSIIQMGIREKDNLIEQAKASADKMIRDAEIYSQQRILAAKKALADEMVDAAISMVTDKLTKEISMDDDNKLFTQFLDNLESTGRYFR
ncbi:MAG: ATP synthase F0 subunit B [Thermodesulfobacteriota bacterium]|nr:ATP synthase F0 subunit B [Thermodesulfobacteriota bacterium]